MSEINAKFSQALKSRLNGKGAVADLNGPLDSPARARQAEVPADAITAATAEAMGLPFHEALTDRPVSHEFLTSVPISFARRHGIIGLAGENGAMPLAISDLSQWLQLGVLGRMLGKKIDPFFAPREEILRTINAAYQQQTGQAQRVIEELDGGEVLREIERAGQGEDLLDVSTRAPVIKLVNLMLFEAVKRRASDVHVQPYEERLVVRLRIDGVLHDVFAPPRALQEEIISRIKVMGGMNIAERRLAQDGRATVEVGDRIVDLRISTIPTSFGERAVIRLLDKSIRLYELGELGMPENVLESMRRLIRMDHGIILVTGPTGSGKTTTLYAALQEINSQELNILTLEDPIEYRLEGISQTQVSDRKGMTFASGLRHVLRQDPDIIMVGEIRDPETANMAIQSALTGHLVFSTLHTNDAAGAVARLLDLGVEPYLVASSLLGVMAQRLVRRVCPACRTTFTPAEADLRHWNVQLKDLHGAKLYRGVGCKECLNTGYRERLGIFELLTVTEPIQELILQHAKSSTIKRAAVEDGMTTLRIDGVAKAFKGITTMDEVARVTGRDEF
ncbi:MAG TPA: type II secretion system ATPase GspE [Phycisphaerae bacterium]|nr:type II secretion system ATPase GspE [Phycisphaerae bacterium]